MRWLVPLLLFFAACSSVDVASKRPERTPEQEQKYKEAVGRGEVKIGMTKEEVRKAWGPPTRTSKTTYARRSAMVWSYAGRYTDIFFDDDGFVMAWQSATG
ncbi:MAG TPA: hypothetical protein VFY93_07170 [Planctomycetota bacterium]|nr:hypothetical protein [Planctomycetota bacterium]